MWPSPSSCIIIISNILFAVHSPSSATNRLYNLSNLFLVTKDKVAKTNPRPKIFHLNDTALKIIKYYANNRKENMLIFKNANITPITTVIIEK